MNVFDAAVERLKMAFEEFDNIYVSFSGGKDSGVLLNLAIYVSRKYFNSRKIGCYHMDYEGQYDATTKYVERTLSSNLDVLDVYWCCMPVSAQCSASMYQSDWIPWELQHKEIWCRDMPIIDSVINESNHSFDKFYHGMPDYDFNKMFHAWIHEEKQAKKTLCLVGIRTQESLHRYTAIHNKEKMYKDYKWTTQGAKKVLFNGYPIYDWDADDIWTANYRFGWDYNDLYNLFYYAGVKVNNMRVASPFNDCAAESLNLYKVIEPNTWGKLVGRVNGANFTAIYGGTKAQGYGGIDLPKGHTWKTYCEFLLKTLPEDMSELYKKKFIFSHKYWTEMGGAVSTETADALRAMNIEGLKFMGKPENKRKYTFDKEVVIFKDYPDDLNIINFVEVPTYKRMCITILKNDYSCKYMGFGQTKFELEKRKIALEKYKNAI